MDRTQKKLFGFFGLFVVIVITAIAIAIRDLKASAATTDSVTETFEVRVLSSSPVINSISGITNQQKVTSPSGTIEIDYESCETIQVSIKYVDGDTTKVVRTFNPSDDYGIESAPFNIKNFMPGEKLSYGQYIITVRGEGQGSSDEKSVAFEFVPVEANVVKDGDDTKVVVDYDDSTDGGVAYIIIEILDENGQKVTGDGLPIKIEKPATSAPIDFGDYGLEEGNYQIIISAFGEDDDENPLYEPIVLDVKYDGEEDIDIVVPDTGTAYHMLNLANKDYLITGLMIFFFLAISGIVLIANKNKKSKSGMKFSSKRR